MVLHCFALRLAEKSGATSLTSVVKPKLIVFSCAWCRLNVFALSSDCFIGLSATASACAWPKSDEFGFWFYDTQLEAALIATAAITRFISYGEVMTVSVTSS